jgi:hypothetical protein
VFLAFFASRFPSAQIIISPHVPRQASRLVLSAGAEIKLVGIPVAIHFCGLVNELAMRARASVLEFPKHCAPVVAFAENHKVTEETIGKPFFGTLSYQSVNLVDVLFDFAEKRIRDPGFPSTELDFKNDRGSTKRVLLAG